ncbi:hypothetical protein QR680_014482 [Steinernema hermaphroditum]|uniref:Centrosomin N-terminal motif 1 domain-containing protein n=1 Tax=Steinernema hermaphroditum TaxID=289476 RepID=A0AA39M448_9BILA|nr:hypothetical protein QR680_014482 [Steinernema hermaphroditum]
MSHPELTELEATIESLRKENYELQLELRIVRGQLPRVQSASVRQLQDDVMRLGDEVAQLRSERVRFAADMEELNKMSQRLLAEKNAIKQELDTSLEELKDELMTIIRESNENYRLYMEQKDYNVLLKADLDRMVVAIGEHASMDMSVTTSDENMSIMSERDKELMRLTSTVFQTKVDAERKSRELQGKLDKAKEQIGMRDDTIRQLTSKNNSAEKKVKEVENLLQQRSSRPPS